MRHCLTIGELAKLFNTEFKIGCDLEVILMKGWRRRMYYNDTGLFWVSPSPNLPTPASAVVYPGQVIWEGTNISEGRGTTQPFEIFGSPFMDHEKILSTMDGPVIPGAFLRPLVFEPTSNKWAKRPCRGFQIHVIEPNVYRPYTTTLKLLSAILLHNHDQFEWKQPPYEYEYEKLPIDLILGDGDIRQRIEQLEDIEQIEESWENDLKDFCELSRQYYLYDL